VNHGRKSSGYRACGRGQTGRREQNNAGPGGRHFSFRANPGTLVSNLLETAAEREEMAPGALKMPSGGITPTREHGWTAIQGAEH